MKSKTDYTVDLFYRIEKRGQIYDTIDRKIFPTAESARDFRMTAMRTIGQWPPRGAFDVEVGEINGPDIAYDRPTRESFMAGIALVREALAKVDGPLVADIAKAAKVPRSKPVEQRVAS